MSTQELTSTNNVQALSVTSEQDQYTLSQILGIWSLAAIPMGILSWVVYPVVARGFEADPLGSGVARIVLLTIGLAWLFFLSLLIVRWEEGDLRWGTVKRRLRLNTPRDPKTGETRRRLWLWVIPFVIAIVVWEMALKPYVSGLWVSLFPFFAEPPGYGFGAIFESQEILARLVGAWWFFGLFVVFSVFNSILGEEFLFRGVLLPRMEGAFGRYSWVANGVLHAVWHVHQPWVILETVISAAFLYTFPSWYFRSTWMGVIVHSVQNVFFAFLILGVILGLA